MNPIWASFLAGTALMAGSVWLGWFLARFPQLPPVQAVDWWIRRVVLPLLHRRSWLGRAAIIFANNIAILTALVAAGPWPGASLVGIALVGLSLGTAFRRLLALPDYALTPRLRLDPQDERRVRIGLALNMLEPPAILAAVTLSIADWLVPLSASTVWGSFLVWVVPAMLVAAAGEAMWLGAGRRADEGPDGGQDAAGDPRPLP